jgi:hypothetical protein
VQPVGLALAIADVGLAIAGEATISVIRDAVTELERDWATRLGPEDWGQLKRLLAALNEAAADAPAIGARR